MRMKVLCKLFGHRLKKIFAGARGSEEQPEFMFKVLCLRCGKTLTISESRLKKIMLRGRIVEDDTELIHHPCVEVKLEDIHYCPNCGTHLTKKNFHSAVDETTDDEYRWIKCGNCDWSVEG